MPVEFGSGTRMLRYARIPIGDKAGYGLDAQERRLSFVGLPYLFSAALRRHCSSAGGSRVTDTPDGDEDCDRGHNVRVGDLAQMRCMKIFPKLDGKDETHGASQSGAAVADLVPLPLTS